MGGKRIKNWASEGGSNGWGQLGRSLGVRQQPNKNPFRWFLQLSILNEFEFSRLINGNQNVNKKRMLNSKTQNIP